MIVVGDKQIEVVKRGYTQAKQIASLSRWLSKYIAPVIENATTMVDNDNAMAAGISILVSVLSSVEADSLVELGMVITGEDEEFVKENFDMEWVIDGMTELLSNKAFARLIQPFFGR